MATEIGALRALLSASIAQFETDMGKAGDAVGKFQQRFSNYSKSFAKAGAVMTAAVTAPLIAFAASSVKAFTEQEDASAAVNAALSTMGDRAGFTAEQLGKMAEELQATTKFGDDAILSKVTANLLTFGNISGEVFARAQAAALDLSERLGTDLQSSALQLGKALNDPIAGLTALRRVGVSFSADQQEVIKKLVDTGRVAEAQNIILQELERQYGNVAEAAAATTSGQLAQMANQWNDVQEEIGKLVVEFLPPLIDLLRDVIAYVRDMSPETKRWVIQIAAAAAAIGPLLLGLAALTGALSGSLRLIGLVIAGLGKMAGAMNIASISAKNLGASLAGISGKGLLGVLAMLDVQGKVQENIASGKWSTPESRWKDMIGGMNESIQKAIDAAPNKPAPAFDPSSIKSDAPVLFDKDRTETIADFKKGLKDAAGAADDASRAIEALQDNARATDRAVRDFAGGGLAPLDQRLLDVKDRYDDLKRGISETLAENEKYAASNSEAAAAVASLRKNLVDLEAGYAAATAATKAQYAAEEAIANLRAQQAAGDLRQQMTDLSAAAGGEGVMTQSIEAVRQAEQHLADLRLENSERQLNWELAYDEAVRGNDTAEAQRLLMLIELAKQLDAQIGSTTAQQLADQARIADAFNNFAEDLSNEISDMILDWKFDLEGVRNIWKQLAKDLFIKPFMDSVTSGLGGFLKGFAGGFATGGTLMPGEWGFAGEEGIEPIFAGRRPLHVMSNDDAAGGKGVTVVQNISTPDYGAFRSNRRQLARQAKEAMGA